MVRLVVVARAGVAFPHKRLGSSSTVPSLAGGQDSCHNDELRGSVGTQKLVALINCWLKQYDGLLDLTRGSKTWVMAAVLGICCPAI